MPVGSYDLITALSHYLGPNTRDAFMHVFYQLYFGIQVRKHFSTVNLVEVRTRGQGMMEKISVDVQDLAALGIPARMREWCREMPIAWRSPFRPSSSARREFPSNSSYQCTTAETSPSFVCHYGGRGGHDDTRSRNERFDQKEQGTTALELSVNLTKAREWTEVTS